MHINISILQFVTVQNPLHNLNGMTMGGRGRPASVDNNTAANGASNDVLHHHELQQQQQQHQQQQQQQLGNVGAAANIVRRNIAAGKLVFY